MALAGWGTRLDRWRSLFLGFMWVVCESHENGRWDPFWVGGSQGRDLTPRDEAARKAQLEREAQLERQAQQIAEDRDGWLLGEGLWGKGPWQSADPVFPLTSAGWLGPFSKTGGEVALVGCAQAIHFAALAHLQCVVAAYVTVTALSACREALPFEDVAVLPFCRPVAGRD